MLSFHIAGNVNDVYRHIWRLMLVSQHAVLLLLYFLIVQDIHIHIEQLKYNTLHI